MTGPAPAAPRLGVVLLAAGLSRRMDGPNKLLLDLHGRPAVRWVAQALAAALPEAPRVAVVGRDAAAVTAALDGLGFTAAPAPRPAEGQGASLATGVAALPAAGLDGLLVALGDMPALRPASIAAVVAAWQTCGDPARAIVRPMHGETPGHPVLWGAAHRPALARLAGEAAGRTLLQAQAERLVRVPCDDPGVALDIDRPEDVAVAAAALAAATPPAAREKQWSWGGGPS